MRLSYLRRDGRTRVTAPGEDLLPGDHVVMVGDPASIKEAAPLVGEVLDHNLEDDRSDLAFERIVVSNPDVAGRSVSELNVTKRFGAVITRVRRGDLDLLARDDLDLQLGDHVAVVVPTDELDDIAEWLGDSERRVAEVDGMAFGIEADEAAGHNQVAGAGNRQKFGEAFDDAEEEGFEGEEQAHWLNS